MVYPEAKLIPAFKLTDHNGEVFDNEQLTGKWSIVFFGYTYCPDICPTTLTALAQLANNLPTDLLAKLQFIFFFFLIKAQAL